MQIDKKVILEAVLAQLKADLDRQKAANENAAAGATDSESRAETKWDTGGLEASYLARGYVRQFEQMASQYDQLKSLQLIDYSNRSIGVGALIECEMEGYVSWFFLLPCCGGLELNLQAIEITIITPESPVGRAILNKTSGSTYVLPNGRSAKILNLI